MPRDGSGVYSADWVNASPNTTIESAKQNAMVADLVADANAARPITAGGTGETTARLADGTWRFKNTADPTKLLAVDISAFPTATTRTLVFGSNGALDVASGGTNALNAANARINLGTNDAANLTTGTIDDARISSTLTQGKAYRNGNILGAVGQSGGTPTGAIIETGVVGSGNYVKFADGTMICTKTVSLGTVTFSASGSVYISAAQAGGAFAQTFVAAPVVAMPTILSSTGLVWPAVAAAATDSSFPQFYLFSSGSGDSTGTTMSLIAVGRWF